MDTNAIAVAAPTLLSTGVYSVVQAVFVLSALRRRPAATAAVPSVSILKPIAGTDEELRENLETFANLDYPDYEILLGIADPDDSAVPIVRAFIASHPGLRARLILT